MRNLKRGFTLLELMIAISLMLIIMLMLRSMFTNAQAMYLRAAKRVDVYSQARAALDIMEQDLMRLQAGEEDYHSINLRTTMPDNLNDPEANANSAAYSKLDDWTEPQDDQTVSITEFMSFVGRNTWFDKEERKYVTGDAFVAYYLRRRLPVGDEQYAGGYLVRRIIPIRSLAEIVAIGNGAEAKPLYPTEDELASFVYGVRVYADDQAAYQLGDRFGNWRYNTMPEVTEEAPNAQWMWVKGTPGARPPSSQSSGGVPIQLQLPTREDRAEFGGNWSTQTQSDRDFVSSRWNYPNVVMIDLMMIDRRFERYDGEAGSGTYRSFARAVQLPVSGPMFRLDDTDMNLLR